MDTDNLSCKLKFTGSIQIIKKSFKFKLFVIIDKDRKLTDYIDNG